jgi:hypothetical protein
MVGPAKRKAGAKSERKYSFYPFLALALDGVSGQHHAPAELSLLGKDPSTIGHETRWASELVWTQRVEEKFFTSTRIEPRMSSL